MTRFQAIEASRLARQGRDTTAPVRVDREPGDGVRLARAALVAKKPHPTFSWNRGMHDLASQEFRQDVRKAIKAKEKAALLEQLPRTGMRAVVDGEFRMAMRKKIGRAPSFFPGRGA